ncbi:sensor histidine kinase [Belliella kenyensis]|uniref:histidine kinase n=1 Tax=Belliella kenyensis TaxID=1472724 RepID=A0ABV8ET85_9BACT|nr:ATP-binding protein [Belliella kenyensis]MCH7402524.1 histidine kinase [Belliella kenyensis]MDN3603322.1 histidine kinase [Belliella kenyensis]
MTEGAPSIFLIILLGFVLTLLMGSFIVLMALLHRKRQLEHIQKIDALQSEFDKTMLRVEKEIQEDTLTHVGRELHDNIGQLLSLTKLTLSSNKPEKSIEAKSLLNQVIKEVRGLSKSLNLDWVSHVSIDDFIKRELAKLEALDFCKVEFENIGHAFEIDNSKKLVLIRVIQECLNNAIKHAKPSLIILKIHYFPDHVQILVSDDGLGFEIGSSCEGSGLLNLSKRMEMIGGTILINSELQKGTQIKLKLPSSMI